MVDPKKKKKEMIGPTGIKMGQVIIIIRSIKSPLLVD